MSLHCKETHILICLYVGIIKCFIHVIHQSMFAVAIIIPNAYLQHVQKIWMLEKIKVKIAEKWNRKLKDRWDHEIFEFLTCSILRSKISHALLWSSPMVSFPKVVQTSISNYLHTKGLERGKEKETSSSFTA